LDTLVLGLGDHEQRDDGLCLMEAVAWFADEPHSAAPRCVSPVLISFGDRGNDGLPDERRQRLVPLIPRLVGTRGDGLDEQRAYMALDWLIRTYTPTWLELAGLTAHAQALRHLRRIVGLPTAQTAGPAVGAARSQAAADWVATRWDFSWDGAEVAARDAVRAATTLVAGAGAQAAAWGLTDWRGWAAAWDNAWDAAKVRRAMGRIDEVVTHHKSALALAIDVGDRYEQARALDGIAHTCTPPATRTRPANTGRSRSSSTPSSTCQRPMPSASTSNGWTGQGKPTTEDARLRGRAESGAARSGVARWLCWRANWCSAHPPIAVGGAVSLCVCGRPCPGTTSMADADDVRRLALALPHVIEIDSDGFDFRVADKGFVWSYPERRPGKPRLIRTDIAVLYVGDEAEKQALLLGEPEVFFTTPGYDGLPLVMLRLAQVNVDRLRELVTDAWRMRAPDELVRDLDDGADSSSPDLG